MRFLIVAILLLSCSTDSGATLACDRFHRLANEADLLTLPEQRERVQGIWDAASASEDADISTSARDMLSAITSGDTEALGDAADRMDTACADVEPL